MLLWDLRETASYRGGGGGGGGGGVPPPPPPGLPPTTAVTGIGEKPSILFELVVALKETYRRPLACEIEVSRWGQKWYPLI